MGEFTDQLHQSEHYRPQADGGGSGGQQGRPRSSSQGMGPVLQLEKTDVQFWADVLTVVLLFLIWRELAGGGS